MTSLSDSFEQISHSHEFQQNDHLENEVQYQFPWNSVKSPESMFCVEVGRHDGMQTRFLEREFEISYGSRNLLLSDFVMIA